MPSPVSATPAAAAPPAARACILVVDDELGPRESLKLILESAYEVVLARDGREALAQLTARAPDMVISDIRMPCLDGMELLHEVKRRDPDMPFVLLTGYGSFDSVQEALRAGATDYLSKPYLVEDIRQTVARSLAKAAERRHARESLARLQALNARLLEHARTLELRVTASQRSAEIIHDLSNPITALRGYVGLLEEALQQPSRTARSEELEYVHDIREQAEHCFGLIHRFLDYMRNLRPAWERVNINEMIELTLSLLRMRLHERHVRVCTDLQPDLPPAWALSVSLQQVLSNLVVNALRAMAGNPRRGRLHISTRLLPEPLAGAQAQIAITIADNGAGIPPELLDRVWEPFFSARPNGAGSGLGLAICRRAVAEHGGTIEVESTVGQGTRFCVRVPARTSMSAESPMPVPERSA
jgi:signal transduction histidine kinase